MSHTQNSYHSTTYTATPPLDLTTSYQQTQLQMDPLLINSVLEGYDPQFPAPAPAEWTTVTDPLPIQLPQEDLSKKVQEIQKLNKALIQVNFIKKY